MSHYPKPVDHDLWYYLLEVFFLGTQAGTAWWQKMQIAANIPVSHVLWSAITAGLVIGLVWWYHKKMHSSWWKAIKFGAALLLIRFASFSLFLNWFRHKQMFYTGSGSLQDRLIGRFFPWVWGMSLVGLIYLQLP